MARLSPLSVTGQCEGFSKGDILLKNICNSLKAFRISLCPSESEARTHPSLSESRTVPPSLAHGQWNITGQECGKAWTVGWEETQTSKQTNRDGTTRRISPTGWRWRAAQEILNGSSCWGTVTLELLDWVSVPPSDTSNAFFKIKWSNIKLSMEFMQDTVLPTAGTTSGCHNKFWTAWFQHADGALSLPSRPTMDHFLWHDWPLTLCQLPGSPIGSIRC